ncbi:MAG TPA: MFS transporter [Candidatus Eremiobacteraceae bacterium]
MPFSQTARDELREDPPPGRARFGAFSYRDFRLLWSGLLVSNVGSWMQMLAQGWLVVQLSSSAAEGSFYLGMVGLVRSAPVLAFSGFAGALADRLDRRRILTVTQILMGTSALVLGILVELHTVKIWHVMVMAAVSAGANAFDAPTRQAMLPQLVGPRDLMSAIGLNSAAFNGPALVGPALGGLLVAAVGIAPCFFINAASFGAVLVALAMMRPQPPASVFGKKSLLGDAVDGFTYVGREPRLLAIFALLSLVGFVARPYLQLLPAFIKAVLGGGPQELGIVMGAAGGGALAGSLITALIGISRGRGAFMIASAAVAGAALVWFSTSTSVWPACAALVLLGGSIMLFMGMSNTLIQTYTPAEMRGRVISIYTMTVLGFMPLGSGLLGWVASITSLPITFAVCGALVVIAAAALALRRDVRALA